MTETELMVKNQYPRLIEVLEHIDMVEAVTVRAVYGGQFGHLVFSHKEFIEQEDSERPISEFDIFSEKHKEDETWENIGKEFNSVISDHHNIFNVSSTDSDQFRVENENYWRWALDAESPVTLAMKIPSSHK